MLKDVVRHGEWISKIAIVSNESEDFLTTIVVDTMRMRMRVLLFHAPFKVITIIQHIIGRDEEIEDSTIRDELPPTLELPCTILKVRVRCGRKDDLG